MNEERPTHPGLEFTEEDIASLRQRYTAQDVVQLFGLLGLPVCDDPVIIAQVAARDKARREQDSLSNNPAMRQQAALWLTAYQLTDHPGSRRELLLITQEEANHMLAFRLERQGQADKLYGPEIRDDLKAAAIRGFALSDDLAERFLRAFEHGCNLRFGARVPLVLRSFDVRASAEQTFGATLTTLLPPVSKPAAERPRISPSTEPMRAVRLKAPSAEISLPSTEAGPPPTFRAPKPPAPSAPAPGERRPSGVMLMPGNAIARLIVTQEDGQASECELTQPTTSIGRTPESDIFLKEDRRVSRQHAVIHRPPTAFILTDLNSANGTFLNGTMLTEPAVLHPGDRIRVGHTDLLFLMEALTNHHRQ